MITIYKFNSTPSELKGMSLAWAGEVYTTLLKRTTDFLNHNCKIIVRSPGYDIGRCLYNNITIGTVIDFSTHSTANKKSMKLHFIGVTLAALSRYGTTK